MRDVFSPAFVYLKPLLFKWAVFCVMLTFLSTGFLVEAMAKNGSSSKIDREANRSKSQESRSALSFSLSEEKTKKQKPQKPKPKKKRQPSRRSDRVIPGNGYDWGNCTWYAKNRRPDLPNDLGNADAWVYSAQSRGIPTGSTPKIGAIGQSGMHVVYIEKVNSDGTVSFSEMNFAGLGVVSHRTLPASSFTYIY